MYESLDPPDRAKLVAAYHALSYIEGGMRVGLGTGSTAAWLVKLIGARQDIDGIEIQAVPTSEATEALATRMGIETTTLESLGWLDLTIDGADEFDSDLILIKGGGGALLREKIVASASDRMVVIADPSKMVETLGAFPLPVEVIPFGWKSTEQQIADVLEDQGMTGRQILRRTDGDYAFETDEGNFILDLHLKEIEDPDALHSALLSIPGVVETGLFLDIAQTVVVGASSGEVEIFDLDESEPEAIDVTDDDRLAELLAWIARREGT